MDGREVQKAIKLLVEDDVPIQQFLKRAAGREAGYQVDTTVEWSQSRRSLLALEGIHDAFTIDLGLPDLDGIGLDVCPLRLAVQHRF